MVLKGRERDRLDLEWDLDSSLHTRFNKFLRDLEPDLADRDLAALDLDLDLSVFLALPRLDRDLDLGVFSPLPRLGRDLDLGVFSPFSCLDFLLTPPCLIPFSCNSSRYCFDINAF